jgi:hypothetical protein
LIANKIIGKTYSLYGGTISSDSFYEELSAFAEWTSNEFKNLPELLELIRKSSKKKSLIRNELKAASGNSYLGKILLKAEKTFTKYFTGIDSHLKNLTFREKCDSTLSTSREQYLLYMLEIELANRINVKSFSSSEIRFAFLPHCLHDLEKDCLSASDGVDYVCKGCSKVCSINSVNKLMKAKNIKAYIWKEADLKKIFKLAKANHQSVGAFGVACIPELVNGMRLCAKYNVPAIGVPLDANRCVRWMGNFYPNSVNEKKIISLIN